jgi:hypothetical protein
VGRVKKDIEREGHHFHDRRWEVDDIWESTSAKSLNYECEGHRPLSVIPGDDTEVRRWSTHKQGESRRGEGK